MEVYRGNDFKLKNRSVVSIGMYDGVHRGHAAVFSRVKSRSDELKAESVIVTFWPHPRTILSNEENSVKLLSTLDEKIALIEKHGIDHLYVIPFTKQFSSIRACNFIKEYLIDRANLSHLVFGFNHYFGYRREGNFDSLKECANQYGFGIEQLSAVTDGEFRISSSAIRDLLDHGDVKQAAKLLSYNYSISGSVKSGYQVGRKIGFPTANIKPDYDCKIIPANGVYAVEVLISGSSYYGMMNIGLRPTVNNSNDSKTLEVHLFDVNRELYGNRLDIKFIDRVRDEKRFAGLDELKLQLENDKITVQNIVAGNNPLN